MATGQERKQARADRYRKRALQAKTDSSAAYMRAEELVEHIPPGQPILVEHHSETKHRRALECSWNALGKSVELEQKANYYEAKAEAAEHNQAIYAEDDDAIENLTAKIAALESLQERMKMANRIVKGKKQTQNEKIEALCKLGFDRRNAEKLFVPNCFGQIGFADFTIRNNGANIRRLKIRLENVAQLKNTPTKEYTIGEVRIIENTETNRLQVFFPEKPSEEVRKELKSNGFRWASIAVCWQSYLNDRQKNRIEQILKNETAKS